MSKYGIVHFNTQISICSSYYYIVYTIIVLCITQNIVYPSLSFSNYSTAIFIFLQARVEAFNRVSESITTKPIVVIKIWCDYPQVNIDKLESNSHDRPRMVN